MVRRASEAEVCVRHALSTALAVGLTEPSALALRGSRQRRHDNQRQSQRADDETSPREKSAMPNLLNFPWTPSADRAPLRGPSRSQDAIVSR